MPMYEYQCRKCGHRFEKIQQFSDKPVTVCPQCGGELEKLLSQSSVRFKGSGWYATDYARKGSTPPTSGSKSEGSKSEGSSTTEGSKTDSASKSESSASKSEKKSDKK